MAIMIAVPANVARLAHGVQKDKMKKVYYIADAGPGRGLLTTFRVTLEYRLLQTVSHLTLSPHTFIRRNLTVMGGAIRMVKLFGWEDKMSHSVDEKRRAELRAIRKLRMFNLLNKVVT